MRWQAAAAFGLHACVLGAWGLGAWGLWGCGEAIGTGRAAPQPEADAAVDAALPPLVYTNPVVPFDCPDPGVVAVDDAGAHAMLCTGGTFPVRRSAGLTDWQDTGAAVLPAGKAAWAANGGRNWAPELHRVGDRFVAYFTSVNAANVLSIGVAHGPSPEGPFEVLPAPLVEHADGVIDATYFRDDDGRHYLFFKIDGNAHQKPTPILVRELAEDGLSFAPLFFPVEVLTNDAASWEGGVVEAPWVVKRDGYYYLFYSGNVYDERYRLGVARATSVIGPYEKRGPPLLVNNAAWLGPGHASVVTFRGRDVLFYHAWNALPGGGRDDARGRFGLMDAIDWVSGWPVIGAGSPTTTEQTLP